jgi:replicative DNA helicase
VCAVPVSAQGRVPPHDLEAETSVLGAILLDPTAITRVLDQLSPDDFYRENNGQIYRAAQNLFREGEPIDNVTLAAELGKLGVLERVGGRAHLALLQESVPTAANVEHYARIVKDKAYKRRLISAGTQVTALGYDESLDAEEAVNQAQANVYAISDDKIGAGLEHIYNLLKPAMDRIDAQMASGGGVIGIPSGFHDLDRMTNGFKAADLAIIAGRPSMGKCVRSNTLVADPVTGRRVTIEEAVRCRLPSVLGLDHSGRVRPTGVATWVDSGVQPCYRVTTRTGRTIEATHHHPFLTVRGWEPLHDIPIGERVAIPRRVPCFGSDTSLGLDQVRLLGYVVAEGGLTGTSPMFSNTDPDIVRDIRTIVASRYPDLRLRFDRRRAYAICRERGGGRANPLTTLLRELEMWGRRADARRFPEVAWQWESERLRQFVRAVMSCDGTIYSLGGYPRIEFAVASEGLASDMQHALARFGVVARRWRKRAKCWRVEVTEPRSVATYQREIGWIGEKAGRFPDVSDDARRPDTGHLPSSVWPIVRGVAMWGMTPTDLAVAAGARPADQRGYDPHVRRGLPTARLADRAAVLGSPRLARLGSPDLFWDEVVSIEPTGAHQVYDLTVPDGANFVAADMLVHNTSFALNVTLHAAVEQKKPVAIFSLEMSKEQLVERMLCEQARIDAQRLHRGTLSDVEYERLAGALGPLGDAPIFIDDSPMLDDLTMRLKARQARSREGIELIVLDYLQLMHGRSRDGDANRVQEVSAISRALKSIARELRVPVIAISQLSRAPEARPDKRPILSDLRESGCVTGDTRVYLPDLGTYRPIRSLVGATGFRVLALDTDSWTLVPRRVTNSFSTGTKTVFRLTTRLGRTVRATANHKFLVMDGWKRLDELARGNPVAVRSADAVSSPALRAPAMSDVYWDEIVSIETDGEEEVFDLTVEDLHNFVADNTILHNSIEQDADIVMFLYRDDYYNREKSEKPGIAEVIVAKHRNGPTGSVELVFRKELTRFENLERRRPEPVGPE